MRRYRRIIALAVVTVVAVLLTLLVDAAGSATGLQQFEDFTLDLRQQTTAESFQEGMGGRTSDIALVLFDEYSISSWPWLSPFPRAHLAELIEALSEAGARTIGLDVFVDRVYPALNEIDDGDDLLREAIERAGNVVLVNPIQQTDSGPVSSPPHPYFADVAAAVGSAELPSSFETFRDGTLAVRSGGALEPSFALALYAHARGLDVDSLLAGARASGRLDLPGLPEAYGRIPEAWFDGSGTARSSIVPFRIRYAGPPSSVNASDPPGTFQASASGTVPDIAWLLPELFRDKIVLLGTGFHDQDKFRTPFFGYEPTDLGYEPTEPGIDGDMSDAAPPAASPQRDSAEPYGWMYGVEVHANALQNMLDGEYVRPTGAGGKLLLLLLVAGTVGGVTFWKGTMAGGISAVAALIATGLYAWWAWAGVVYLPGLELFNLGEPFRWVPVGAPMVSGAFAYVGSVAYVAVIEGREKRFIKNAFGKYLSPEVVAEIAEDPEALRLGGQKRPISLLFSDLSGFTTMSETMDPEALLTLLNEYLDDMTDLVLEERGTLDKYIGDAIMAFWNAPKSVEDHADCAMRAAVAMQRQMAVLNARWAEGNPDHQPLRVRIGLHTGEVVVGNVGGQARFDYSAIGDSVNLAARLEPANKTYGTLTMVSEVTLAAGTAALFRVRELDTIAVAGKVEPVKVYELLEMADGALPAGMEETLVRYEEGLAAYREHDWEGALEHFEAALDATPSDRPSALYAERCTAHIESPPPPDWDFVVYRTEK